MTKHRIDEDHAFVGCRLDLPHLRGEVTAVAGELRESSEELSLREQATVWTCNAMDEAALLLWATIDMSPEERAQIVSDVLGASERLYDAETNLG